MYSWMIARRPSKKLSSVTMIMLAVAVVVLSAFSGEADSKKSVQSAEMPSLVFSNNNVKNPGFTAGPACTMRVLVLLDRSGSMQPSALPGTPANQAKTSIKEFYDLLHQRSLTHGNSKAEVLFFAFGAYGVLQNGPTPEGVTPAGPQGWDWWPTIDVGAGGSHGPTYGLDYQKRIVDETYFYGDPVNPSLWYRDYFGTRTFTNAQKNAIAFANTNWDDPLSQAANYVRFWTGGDATKRGDDDWDLVLFVTDGLPNMNNGPDHVASDPVVNPVTGAVTVEPGLSYTSVHGNEDIDNPRDAVNFLRTGEQFTTPTGTPISAYDVRPPINVIGILAGSAAEAAAATPTMNHVFGSGNWYGTSDFSSGLQAAMEDAATELGCGAESSTVSPAVQLQTEIVPPGSTTIEEGSTTPTVVKISVKNPGDVALNNVVVHYNGSTYTVPGRIEPGETKYATSVSITAPMGHPSETIDLNITVTSDAVLDSGQVPSPESGGPHPSDSKTVSFSVSREELPT